MSLAIWRELSKDDRVSPKDRFGMWAIGTSVALAGLTGKMIIENMLHRTVGKALSKATIPLFVISLAVSGGYTASSMIDPDKGTERFTESLLDPVGTARTTAAIGIYTMQDYLSSPQIGTGQNFVSSEDVYQQLPFWNRYLNLF